MLNPLHLKTLSVVLRVGSFAAAGRRLGYTGSAVSQQMAALEAESGLSLFHRDPHGVRPTPAAVQLSERAGDTLSALASLDEAVREIAAGTRGRLGLGCFPTASEVLVPPALAHFARDFPAVDVRFDDGEPEQLVPRLIEGDLDLVLVYRYSLVPQIWPGGLRRTALFSEPVQLLMPVDFTLESSRRLTDFAEYAWIATREGSAGSLALERSCAAAGFTPQIRYRSNDYDVVRSFVRAGFGVAAVPQLGFVGRSGLQALEVSDFDLVRHVEMLSVPDRRGPAVDAMMDALRWAAGATASAELGLDRATVGAGERELSAATGRL